MLLTLTFLECQINEILHYKPISLQIAYKLCFKSKKSLQIVDFQKFLQIEHIASDRTEMYFRIADYFTSYSEFRFKSRLPPPLCIWNINLIKYCTINNFRYISHENYDSDREIRFKSLEKSASYIKISL